MSFASQQHNPLRAQHITFIDNLSSDDGNSSAETDQIALQTEQKNKSAIDNLIEYLDSEFHVQQEILKLALRIEILETKDKMLTESLGS